MKHDIDNQKGRWKLKRALHCFAITRTLIHKWPEVRLSFYQLSLSGAFCFFASLLWL